MELLNYIFKNPNPKSFEIKQLISNFKIKYKLNDYRSYFFLSQAKIFTTF